MGRCSLGRRRRLLQIIVLTDCLENIDQTAADGVPVGNDQYIIGASAKRLLRNRREHSMLYLTLHHWYWNDTPAMSFALLGPSGRVVWRPEDMSKGQCVHQSNTWQLKSPRRDRSLRSEVTTICTTTFLMVWFGRFVRHVAVTCLFRCDQMINNTFSV